MLFFRKKGLRLFAAAAAALVLSAGVAARTEAAVSAEIAELYQRSIVDAMYAAPDEIYPLVNIEADDPYVWWNEARDKVAVCTWNQEPGVYESGKTVKRADVVWVFHPKELLAWYEKNRGTFSDMDLRLEQLIGLRPQEGYTHFSLLWVSPRDLVRPAYNSDIRKCEMRTELTGKEEKAYTRWFKENILHSYYPLCYPWTRLGYTYDWADNGTEYGLSEFIIRKGAKIHVERTYTNAQFYGLLAAGELPALKVK